MFLEVLIVVVQRNVLLLLCGTITVFIGASCTVPSLAMRGLFKFLFLRGSLILLAVIKGSTGECIDATMHGVMGSGVSCSPCLSFHL